MFSKQSSHDQQRVSETSLSHTQNMYDTQEVKSQPKVQNDNAPSFRCVHNRNNRKRFPLSRDPEPMQTQQEEQVISGKDGLLDPIREPVYVMLIQPENEDGRPLEDREGHGEEEAPCSVETSFGYLKHWKCHQRCLLGGATWNGCVRRVGRRLRISCHLRLRLGRGWRGR